MAELEPRQRRRPTPAPEEAPIGSIVSTPPAAAEPPREAPAPTFVPFATRITTDHQKLLARMKYERGANIQTLIHEAIEKTYGTNQR